LPEANFLLYPSSALLEFSKPFTLQWRRSMNQNESAKETLLVNVESAQVEIETNDGRATESECSKKDGDEKDRADETEEEVEEDKQKKEEQWPLCNIRKPTENDVLNGRGTRANEHPGNIQHRRIVEGRKREYLSSNNVGKATIAAEIVCIWRRKPGRFLKLDETTGFWNDVGDAIAREKTKQALRQNRASHQSGKKRKSES